MLKGKKMNKIIFLLLVVVLVMVCLAGCSEKELEFEGVTTRKFKKDLNELRMLIIISASEQEYNPEIDDFMKKMNSTDYTKKLTMQEVVILETLNKSIDDLKHDLSTGEQTISSYTFDDLRWIIEPEGYNDN